MARSKKTKNSANSAAKGDMPKPNNDSDAQLQETLPENVVEDAEIVESALKGPEDASADEAGDDKTAEADEVLDPEVEPQTASEPVPTTQSPKRPSIFVPLLIGGLIAGAIGFGAAKYIESTNAAPEATGPSETEIALQSSLEAQGAQIANLTAQLETLATENAAKDDALKALQDQIDALPEPVLLSDLPADDTILNEEVAAALAAQKTQIETLSSELEAMTATAKAQMDAAAVEVKNIAKQEERAKARTAVSAIRAALDSGAPFAEFLPEISTVTDIPEVLQGAAEAGVPSLNSLQTSFGNAARDALSASRRAQAGDTTTDRMKLFFQDQLGTRSLIPREGDAPDAVLSRIEAAVKTGDLGAIGPLTEILPEAGQAALSGWLSSVDTRQSAAAAVQSLSDTLAAN